MQGAPGAILHLCYNKDEIKASVNATVLFPPAPSCLEKKTQLNFCGLSSRQTAELGSRGIRALAVARQDNEDGRWRFLGMLTFLEPPYPDTKYAIEQASMLGVEVRRQPSMVQCHPLLRDLPSERVFR
jgi:hypothetical protein